jgi:hypothetical protein
MKTAGRLLLFIAALGCIAAAQGKEFWEKKDYRQWSERECRKLLEDSPWAKSYSFSQVFIDPLQTTDQDRAREPTPRTEYKVHFRSALPIRQALVRLSQIQQKYNQMTPEQQQAYDQQTEGFLAASFSDLIVVHVTYSSNVQLDDRELSRHWQTQTTETLKNFVYLIGPEGEKVPLSQYIVGKGGVREFEFVFPRHYEGRSLVSAPNKSLKLEFPHPVIRGQGGRVLVEFNLKKMLVQGAVVY